MNLEKILKYLIWAGLIGICFIPFIVKSNYFFPYVVPKTLAFRVIVEIIFLAFLWLAIINKEYRPKLNLILVLFFLYIATVFLSSILGGSFYYSFWSNNERSEGLLLLLHLFPFLIIAGSFLRRFKDWLAIFEVSFLSSLLVSLFALGQYLQLSWISGSAGGARLASTIGNAGYVAGYLIFNIFFGFILLFFRKNKWLRWYYVLGILLQIFIVFNTLTRGGILALGFSLFIFIGYLVFFRLKKNKLIRNTGIIILLLGIIFAGLVFFNKQADWVKKTPILQRISSISLEATTAQNRLMTWQSAYQGFKEKPILGYGYENFFQVFDKYFNPKIYRRVSSVVWFDRAHNIIFDRLITGGLIGLFLYLTLLLLPIYYLWKYFRQNKSQYFIPVIFTLIILAYFIQNLFIFEALVTYIPLFLVLAFLSQFCPKYLENFSKSKKPYVLLLSVGLIMFLPILFIFNIKPAAANKGLIEAMTMIRLKQYQEAYDQFIKVIEMKTFGNQEFREHFGKFVNGAVSSSVLEENWLAQAAMRTEQEFDEQIKDKEKPASARNYIMFMRFLNKTYRFNVERLNKSLRLGIKAIELSPTRPQIYYEMGYSQLYLGKHYQGLGQTEKAEQFFNQSIANMQEAIDLNDRVVESYLNMLMILLATKQSAQVQSYLDKMDEQGLNYHTEEALTRIANSAVYAKDYHWTLKFYKELSELAPDKPQYLINLALSYAHLGQEKQAIATAEKIKEFGGDYKKQAELFIQDILAGKFEK